MYKIAAFIVFIGLTLAVVTYLVVSNREPQAPIVIYKETTPLPKTENRTEKPSNTQQDIQVDRVSKTEEPTEDAIHIEPVDFSQPLDDFDDTLGKTEVTQADNEIINAESPFGYGPYPEIPADYFGVPIWNQDPDILSNFPNEAAKNIELIDRVLVKLWKQGDRLIVGGSPHNGKVYPLYDNVIYVEWEKSLLPNGAPYLSVSSTLTGAEESPTPENIMTGDIPSNFTVIDINDAGFDPYQFLNLEDKGY